MVNTKYNTTEDMINKLQQLNGRTKIKFYQNISNYYDAMGYRRKGNTFQFEEDLFIRNAEGISYIYHEALLLLKFLQTKPNVRSLNIIYYDLSYTVLKNRDGKEQEEEYDNVFDNIIMPNNR